MEELFAALSSPGRLWVVRHLAEHGPTRQIELAREFVESGLSASRDFNPGAMSQLVRPLLAVGLIERTGSRGPLRLRYPEQTRQLFGIASALRVAATTDSRVAADEAHARLMRGLTTTVASQSDVGATDEQGGG